MKRFLQLIALALIFTSIRTQAQTVAGNALAFDTFNDVVELPSGMFSGLDDFTIEGWISPHEYGYGPVFDFGNNVSEFVQFTPFHGTPNGPRFTLQLGGSVYYIDSDVRFTSRIWQHFAITLDYGDGTGTLYIDGEVAGTSAIPISFSDMPSLANNYLGRSQDGSAAYYDGALDEFRVWTVARTQQEIQDNMFNVLTGDEANLFAYYDFNDGYGNGDNFDYTTLYDQTSNGNNGELYNFDLSAGNTYSNRIKSTALNLIAWHPFVDGFVGDHVGTSGGTFFDDVFQDADRFGNTGQSILFSGGYITTDLLLTDNQPFSISAWVNWDGSLGFNNIVSWHDGSLSSRTMLSINGDNGGEIRFGDTWANTGVFIPSNAWVHVVATFDGNSTAKIYLDNSLYGTNTEIGDFNFKQTSPSFYIGGLSESTELFYGNIDDVRIYDVELYNSVAPLQGSLNFQAYPVDADAIQLTFEGLTSGVAGYRLERYTNPDSAIFLADLEDFSTSYYDDFNLESGVDYTYELYVIDGEGQETYYSRVGTTFTSPYSTKFEALRESTGNNFNYGQSIAADGAGNIYYFGEFTNDITFGTEFLSGEADVQSAFLLKTDGDLNNFWSKSIEATGFIDAWNVAASANNEIYVTGQFSGDLFFAGETISANSGYASMFLLKFDSDGNEIWARTLDATATSYGLDLTADQAGFVYVGGEVHGDFTFASENKVAYGPLLLKYDSDGNEIWSLSAYGDSYVGWIDNIGFNGTDLVFSGTYYGFTDFNITSLSSGTDGELFIMKTDTDGNFIWSMSGGGNDGEYSRGMAFNNDGDIFITGWYYSSEFSLGGQTIFNQGNADAFLAKINSDGSLAWLNGHGTGFSDAGYGLESDGTNVFQTGITSILDGDIGGISVPNGGLYVAMYDEFGAAQWVEVIEGNGAYGTGLVYANNALYNIGNYRYSYNAQGHGWGNYDWNSRNVLYGKIDNFSASSGGPTITYTSQPQYMQSDGTTARIAFDVAEGAAAVDYAEILVGLISTNTDDYDEDQYQVFNATGDGTSFFFDIEYVSGSDPIGYQYVTRAYDTNGNVGYSDPYTSYIYLDITDNHESVPGTVAIGNRDNPLESDFRMFSITTEGQTVQSVFDYGPASSNPAEMGVFHYNGSGVDQLSNNSSLSVGEGYWLIYTSIAANEMDFDYGGSRPRVNGLTPFIKNLNSGWNQIGNPMPFDMDWGAVLDFNVFIGNIPSDHGISGLFSFKGAFADEGYGTMTSGLGYFVKSNEPFTLYFPTPGLLLSLIGARKGNMPIDAEEWKVNIDLVNEQTGYKVAAVGMKPNASLEYDQYDIDPLPYLNDYIEFNTRTEDQRVVSQSFVPTAPGHIWDFEATTSLGTMENELTWDNSTFGDNDLQMMLIDVASSRVINMREQSTYAFTLDKNRPFKVIFGDKEFIEANLVSESVSVGKAYPNPFSHTLTIPLTLSDVPGGHSVKAEVFNGMGQQVKTLVNQPMNAGFYSLTWDGTNNGGQELSEGIYYYQIQVESASGTEVFNGKVVNAR